MSDTIMRSMDAGLDPDLIEPGRRACQQLSDLVASWFTTTGRPTGLLGNVRARTENTGPEHAVYAMHTARVLFQGGYSTLTAAIANLLDTLGRRPDVLTALRERPGLVPLAVDELVRFDGPVQGTTRLAAADLSIGDVAVRRSQKVTVLFAAANRDPDAFTTPNALILDRSPNRHLGYGWGTHACLGTVADPRRRRPDPRQSRRRPAHPLRSEPALAGRAVRRCAASEPTSSWGSSSPLPSSWRWPCSRPSSVKRGSRPV
ncbi:cytochrome P450 [Streptomyces sp. NPDC048643]|uniref:cytochrome P450 n=1 Tax=Streptomyces sp. NPDC048643 TaxID=3155637 RepID=UPI00341E2D69